MRIQNTPFGSHSFKRGIAIITASLFLSMELFNYVPTALAQSIHSKVQGKNPSKDLSRLVRDEEIRIPPELGFIDESFQGKAGKTVIYLQDAHDSLEAQENIAKMIRHLVEHCGVKTVFEEGYEGPVPTDEYFGLIKDPEIKEKVSYFLMDHLRIGGAEYAHINRSAYSGQRTADSQKTAKEVLSADWKLIGADSIKLHKENIEQYRKSAERKKQIDSDLSVLEKEIRALADLNFPKELKEWIKQKELFSRNQLPLLDYLKRSVRVFPAIRTKDKNYPNIQMVLESENTKDKALIEKAKSINARDLFTEMEQMEAGIANQFLRNKRDRKIFDDYSAIRLLKRLNDLSLSFPEYQAVKDGLDHLDTEQMGKFIGREAKKTLILSRQWEKNIREAASFYEIAQARDTSISKRLEHFLKNPDEQIAVLVFGGFHKNSIKEMLRKHGVSYRIVSPKITSIDPKHQEYYKQLMTVGRLPFELPANLRIASRAATWFETREGNPALARTELRILASVFERNPVDYPSASIAAEQVLKTEMLSSHSSRSEMRDIESKIQNLQAAWKNNDALAAEKAIAELELRKAREAVPLLLEIAKAYFSIVSARAVRAYLEIERGNPVPELMNILQAAWKNNDALTANAAIAELELRKAKEAVPLLLEIAKAYPSIMSARAVRAYLEIKRGNPVPELMNILQTAWKNNNTLTANAAIDALESRKAKEAVPLLLEIAKAYFSIASARAVRAYLEIERGDPVPELMNILQAAWKNEDTLAANAAIDALESRKAKEAVPLLLEIAKAYFSIVSARAVRALVKIGPAEFLREPGSPQILALLGDEIVPDLIGILEMSIQSNDTLTSLAVIEALATLGNKAQKAIPWLSLLAGKNIFLISQYARETLHLISKQSEGTANPKEPSWAKIGSLALKIAYEMLGVGPDAEQAIVTQAYRKKISEPKIARYITGRVGKNHPDFHENEYHKAQLVIESYEMILKHHGWGKYNRFPFEGVRSEMRSASTGKFRINRDVPESAVRKQDALELAQENLQPERNVPALPDENLEGMLGSAIDRLKNFVKDRKRQASRLPIDELVLYLKVLKAMYGETVGKYKESKADHRRVHTNRAEFAGELAHHPRFQDDARRMLEASYAGALRILAEQFPGSFDDLNSLEEMMSIMAELVAELSAHPALRESAIAIINDPKTYGLDELVLDRSYTATPAIEDRSPATSTKTAGGVRGLIGVIKSMIAGSSVQLEIPKTTESGAMIPATDSKCIAISTKAQEFAAISDGLIAAAEKKKSKPNQLKPRPEDVIRARASRLLTLADASVADDPELAEATLKEYQRLIKTFGDRVDFYVAVTLDQRANIMNSPVLRTTLIETVRSIPNNEDRKNMLTQIVLQLIQEGDTRGALNLLEEIGNATFYTFSAAVEELADLLLSPAQRNKVMIEQLERIIENIPDAGQNWSNRKIKLFVVLGNRYHDLGLKKEAENRYQKAWRISKKVPQPAVIRLKYFVPLMREKGINFPVSRTPIIDEARRIGEAELSRDRLSGRPDTLIAVAREYAFNGDYDKAEEVARYINTNMDSPRDHYDHVYGAIIEAAALHGDDDKILYAASKMTHYVKDHFERAAQLLVHKREYQRAMKLGNVAMGQGYAGSSTVGYWGSTQLRIARNILEQDNSQIALVREYLGAAISKGIDSHDLEGTIDLIARYPELDPDGQFTLTILNAAFEHNRSFIEHASHRIILKKLREIIMARVRHIDPSLLKITDVFRQANHALSPPDTKEADLKQMNPTERREEDRSEMRDTSRVNTVNPSRILNLQQDVIVVVEEARIDALSPEMFRELLEIAGLNHGKLHLIVPDALQGKYSERVTELRKVASVYYGFPRLAASDKIPVIGFSDTEKDTLAEFQKRLDSRLAEHMKNSAFGLNQPGIFGVGILYALKDIPADQLPPNQNGFRYDASGRWSAQVLEALQAYTVISTSA